MTVTVDDDENIAAIACMSLSRLHHRELALVLRSAELKSFCSANSSTRWLCITASPFCAQVAISLQQRTNNVCIEDLLHSRRLRQIKKSGTVANCPRPTHTAGYRLSLFVFSNACRSSEHIQAFYIAGLCLDGPHLGNILHLLSWSSRKARNPVQSTATAEILATAEAIDEGRTLPLVPTEVLGTCVPQ